MMGGWARTRGSRLAAVLAIAVASTACGLDIEAGVEQDSSEQGDTDTPTDAGSGTDEGSGSGSADEPAVEARRVDGEPVEVERVVDGDSLELVIGGVETEVRLLGINAPELYTPGNVASCNGEAARDALRDLVENATTVEFVAGEQDRFGRLLGVLALDGVAVTESLVDAGWALALWSAEDERLTALMEAAASSERGMWGAECGEPAASGLVIDDHQVDAPGDDRENVAEEWVTVTNTGSEPVDLNGWTIRDETTSNRFAISGWVLGAGDSVRFRSGSGSNGGGDYFLGEDFPLWSNRGETAVLLDPDGVVAAHAFIAP